MSQDVAATPIMSAIILISTITNIRIYAMNIVLSVRLATTNSDKMLNPKDRINVIINDLTGHGTFLPFFFLGFSDFVFSLLFSAVSLGSASSDAFLLSVSDKGGSSA